MRATEFAIENRKYKDGEKYQGLIPEIKYLPLTAIARQELDFRPEVMTVSDEVAKNMDFAEPIEVTAFRFGKGDDDASPQVTLRDGHHRYAAALQTGRKYLPVVVRAINARGKKLNALIELSDKIKRGASSSLRENLKFTSDKQDPSVLQTMFDLDQAEMKATEVITELYEPESSYKLEWDDQFGRKERVATAYDNLGREIEIRFVPLSDSMIEIEFSRGDEYDITGGGDAIKVFATVIQAIKRYLRRYRPEYLIFSATGSSRIKLYKRLVDRFASQAGYRQAEVRDPNTILLRDVREF